MTREDTRRGAKKWSVGRVIEVLISLPKTLLFNFHYLPLKQAIHLPVLVSHRVWLKELGGNLIIDGSRPGLVKIGFGNVGIFDRKNARSIWEVSGTVQFNGRASLGHGCKISARGTVVFGDGVNITAESGIVAHRKVYIGRNALISWGVLIMDTDLHVIRDEGHNVLNAPKEIVIGDRVWIGCNVLVLKGVQIANGIVVAAGTTLTRSVSEEHCCVAGSPPRIVRRNITWDF
jgi:acetyltransferase-like isoleucine patch superfamily enzyme